MDYIQTPSGDDQSLDRRLPTTESIRKTSLSFGVDTEPQEAQTIDIRRRVAYKRMGLETPLAPDFSILIS